MRPLFKNAGLSYITPLKNMDYIPPKRHSSLPWHAATDHLNDVLSSLGAQINHLDIFYTPPFTENTWAHIDGTSYEGSEYPSRAKLNWIRTGPEARIKWWNIPQSEIVKVGMIKTAVDSNAVSISRLHEDELIGSYFLDGSILHEAGIPHSVHNMASVHRYVVSLQVTLKSAPITWLTYSEAEELLLPLAQFDSTPS